jgi:PIN domain nuclease of toxin-antitoxin system
MSVYVTDAHPLIWYVTSQRNKLSSRALGAFQDAERGEAFIYIPAGALWEISRLEKEGKITLNKPYVTWARDLLDKSCFECVPIDETVVAEARNYAFNRDAFDASIVATARLKDLPLITKDSAITNSGLVEIWW